MERLELSAQKRALDSNLQGLRKAGFVPAIVYGRGFENIPVSVLARDLEKTYQKAGESALISLKVGDRVFPVIIHEIQFQPVKDIPLHVDFYRVRMDEKINAPVKLVFEGESRAVKELGGILVRTVNEIEVRALPGDLPDQLTVSLDRLEKIGDTILAKDIITAKNIELHLNPETVIATVQEPREEEIIETTAPIPEEVEVIKKEKKETEEEEVEKPAGK